MITEIGGYELIERAGQLIRAGEIVAFPTETVYGLGGDGTNETAVKKIYEAKNRPSDNPFIAHLADIEKIDEIAYLSPEAEKIFKAFSPGPITIVLKKRDCIPDCATAGLKTVGVRIPSHPMARAFLRECNRPVVAPSANLSKRVSPTSCKYVYDDMKGKIPLILDGGDCDVGIESTVLSLSGEIPTILRPGIITVDDLIKYLPAVKNHTGEVIIAPAPGMKYEHYAPLAPCFMFNDNKAALNKYAEVVSEGKNPIVLIKGNNTVAFENKNYVIMGNDGKEIAHNVFAILREQEKHVDCILIEALSMDGVEGSVMNRLLKSCGNKIL